MSLQREILFKAEIDSSSTFGAYPPNDSNIIFGLLLLIDNHYYIQQKSDSICGGSGGLTGLWTYPVISDSISQYTNLIHQDSNEKIFENDLIECDNDMYIVQYIEGAFYACKVNDTQDKHLLSSFLNRHTNLLKSN